MISKILQILGLQPQISKVFSLSQEQSFLTVGQNNFGNKIPFMNFEKRYLIQSDKNLQKSINKRLSTKQKLQQPFSLSIK